MFCSKAPVRLLQGTIFAAAMMVAPCAIAHSSHDGYGPQNGAAHHHRHFAERHRHHATLSSRHYSRHLASMKRNEGVTAARYEPANNEARPERAHLSRATYDAMEERRQKIVADRREESVTADLNLSQFRKSRERDDGQRLAADEREAAMTAKLNLAELQKAQKRDDEIARWKQEYSGTASG